MEKGLNDIIDIEQSIKSSPNYDQQIEEIELLKNIIPEKITILKEEPNFNIQLEIEANDIEDPIKKFILIIYLNYNYPEQSPELKIYEINNNISDKSENNIKNKLIDYCNENIGFPVIYQLYEMCQEFANEQEKIKINEEDKGIIPYQLNNLNKIKIINEFPIDIILLKNSNILIVNKDNLIKIYDNQFETILLQTLYSDSFCDSNILLCKYFPSDNKKDNDYLYLFNIKEVLVYEISYLNKKKIYETPKIKINGNIIINFIDKLSSMTDVIEFSHFKNYVFFINNEEDTYLLHKYVKIKKNGKIVFQEDKKYIKNKPQKIFRKLYKINSEKFMIASYTLKVKLDEYEIKGINKMYFIDSKNFQILNSFNIKISPLNKAICNYKDKYIIISYFNFIKSSSNEDIKKKDPNDELYNFEDNDFNKIYHKTKKKIVNYWYYDDYDDEYEEEKDYTSIYNEYTNAYYSYDIAEHYIGIFNAKTNEIVSIYEFDPVRIILNIKDNLLFLLEKEKNEIQDKKTQQIINEIIFHNYFNELPFKEDELSDKYKRDNYISFLLFDEGLKVSQENFSYSNITTFIEINKGILAIGSMKKGIIIYSNNN